MLGQARHRRSDASSIIFAIAASCGRSATASAQDFDRARDHRENIVEDS